MIIGLVRHFKVIQNRSKFLYSAKEFDKIMYEYNNSPVIPAEVDLGNIKWETCISSTLSRASDSAGIIYQGDISETDLLVEVPTSSFINTKWKLPFWIWGFGGRVAWHRSFNSQPENINQTFARVDKVYRMISESGYDNILIITHGFFMKVFFRTMIKNGFKGRMDLFPRNGKLYLLENTVR